jgi:hypothetical protein
MWTHWISTASMILNGSALVFLNLKTNNNKQSIKIDPGTQNKYWEY